VAVILGGAAVAAADAEGAADSGPVPILHNSGLWGVFELETGAAMKNGDRAEYRSLHR